MQYDTSENQKSETGISMIVKGIRHGIATGKYFPGMKLKETAICKEFSASRTPVREAFRILQNDGLLVYTPQRGVQVAFFDKKNLYDSLELRAYVEALSARNAAEDATLEQIREAGPLDEPIRICYSNNLSLTTELDWKIHMCIARMGNNEYVVNVLEKMMNSQMYFNVYPPFGEWRVLDSYKEHNDILNAIEAHLPEIAERYMEIHFYSSIHCEKINTGQKQEEDQ